MSNIYSYNILIWKWIDKKLDIKWLFLLCFKFVDTACLFCEADLSTDLYEDVGQDHCSCLHLDLRTNNQKQ